MELQNNNFTMYEVEEIKQEFLELLKEDEITIDMKNITKIDMSAIQLLLSLKKSCEEENKKLEIINIKEEILASFEISGTAYILGV